MARKASAAFEAKAFLATISRGRSSSAHAKTSVIFRQSDAADAVFYVQKGKIKIVVSSKQGKEAVVGILGPGEFFGEGCLIGQPKRLATAKALSDCEVMRIAKTEMVRVLHDEPAFGEKRLARTLLRWRTSAGRAAHSR
jgi:CRP/FNR family cyclic AMP-dependent transcriptional regulator